MKRRNTRITNNIIPEVLLIIRRYEKKILRVI